MSATETPRKAGRPYDPAARNRAVRRSRYRGVYVYIPEVVIEAAGYDPDQPLYYRLNGYKRSAKAGTVLVSLYREP